MKRLLPQVLAASFALMMTFSSVHAADESTEDLTRLLKLRLGTDQVEPPTATDVEAHCNIKNIKI